jgi:Tol biopolymer transport system component
LYEQRIVSVVTKWAIALGLAGLMAAGTTASASHGPTAVFASVGWVTSSQECSPGTNAGKAVEERSKVFVNGRVLDEGVRALTPGARVKTSSRGTGVICLRQGNWECDLASSTVVRVMPRANIVLTLADGRLTCSTTESAIERRIRTPGSRLLLGGGVRSQFAGGKTVAAAGGQLFSIGFLNRRTTVKVRRGVGVLASTNTLRTAVVLGRDKQAAVPLGRDPLTPTPISLTPAERATFKEREHALPAVTDYTRPKVQVDLGPHDPSSVRTASFRFSSNEAAIFSCALDNTDFRLCTSPFEVTRVAPGHHTFSVRATDTAGRSRDARYAWTVDGSRIVFESFRDGNPELYSVDPDGEDLLRLTTNTISDEHPDWSPGQERITFDRLEAGNLDIYAMNADKTGLTRLTEDPALDRNPSWSPDGTRIAFESYRDGGNRDIYVMNADGSGERRLTTTPAEDLDPAWSPDSSKLVFASLRDGNYEIYVMNADGSGQTRLTTHPAEDFGPTWSGSGIAFHSLRTGDYKNIFVMNADGTGVTPVTRTERNDTNPAWAPDGAHIVFHSDRAADAEEQLYVVDVGRGAPVRVPMESIRANFAPDW